MSLASSHQSFFINTLISTPHKSNKIPRKPITISCSTHKSSSQNQKDSLRVNENNQLAKLALVTLAAGVLTLGSIGPAFARSSSPRINNSRTNVYINPPVAPPLYGGYGYGYGGWGWSPFSFFAPGPSVAVGIGGGFDTLVLFMLLGAGAAVVRRFFRSRNDYDDED
uniref:Transmembrane protein n=1 Tax=Tanacetum cinerariifolium TaxID=118510 RepID=A0A699KDP2_TANCI|nr:transmembrane protein [Tanacetum cinerariifolium]